MCGIAGYLDVEGEAPDEATVEQMAATLVHRGPDASATSVVAPGSEGPTVVFGHRRLAVIDLSSSGDQPMSNADGSVVVSFNGEIYNFRELRRELESHGAVFRSESDTEVIVRAYEEYGDDCVVRFDGMFAFSLWDARRRRLVLARDRLGKKPLYYSWDGRRLTFGSEIKAIRACPWIESEVAWERLPEILALGYVPWPNTSFAGIGQIAPGSLLVLESGGAPRESSFWRPAFVPSGGGVGSSWAAAERQAGRLLRDAVTKRLVADVALGVLLSGGLDSSIIVALMAEAGEGIRTFTVGVGGESSYDERRYARIVARRFRTNHVEVEVRADALSLLERVLWFHDQPFADTSALPTYLITKAARSHVTVALTGDGGDETFGGYERFSAALLADRLPGRTNAAVRALARTVPRSGGYFGLRTRLERFSAAPEDSPESRYSTWVGVTPPPRLSALLHPDARSDSAFRSFFAAVDDASGATLLGRLMQANVRTYLHDDLLVKADRMSMANSMEVRSPFLDTALLGYVAGLPDPMKATVLRRKRLLRRIGKDVLPPAIVRRRKHGFGVPVGRWFRGELREPFSDLVLDPSARTADVLDPGQVRRMLAEHLDRREDHGSVLWTILCIEVWLRSLAGPPELSPPSERGAVLGRTLGEA